MVMLKYVEVAPLPAILPQPLKGLELRAALEAERRALMSRLAAFYKELRAQRRAQKLRQTANLWPLGAGLLLGALAPALMNLVASSAPWTMTVVFPFFILAGRPEAGILGHFAQSHPALVLYAQFPLDGFFAWVFLRHRANVSEVCLQICCFHALGALDLWLLNGGLNRILAG